MTKLLIKRQVVDLRKQGKSYSDILKVIKVSKSSLSLWLKDVPLTSKQKLNLADRRKRAVETYRTTMKLKHQNKLESYYNSQAKKLLPLSDKELMIAGLFLYSGEGNKVSRGSLNITNTDPSVVKFSIYWITKSLKVDINKVHIKLHLYSDMDVEESTKYWVKELKIDKKLFRKPYIKKTKRADIDQKGYGHGTCGIWVYDTILKENVMMAIKVITDKYKI
jgi:hypothetical protein